MKFWVEIEMGNDAMQDAADVAQALQDTGFRLFNGFDFNAGQIRDMNGNKVGTWYTTD